MAYWSPLLPSWRSRAGAASPAWSSPSSLCLVGWWSTRAGAAFSRIATTKGADVSHLMKAITEIRKLYDLQFWVLIALLFLLLFTLLAVSVGPARVLFMMA
ncbi:MAG: hypothetical protein HY700_08030 [Gemmatimonadetes bacterium]|nr:hypothetical protein [Gemmatimonadota bacterium]